MSSQTPSTNWRVRSSIGPDVVVELLDALLQEDRQVWDDEDCGPFALLSLGLTMAAEPRILAHAVRCHAMWDDMAGARSHLEDLQKLDPKLAAEIERELSRGEPAADLAAIEARVADIVGALAGLFSAPYAPGRAGS